MTFYCIFTTCIIIFLYVDLCLRNTELNQPLCLKHIDYIDVLLIETL